jgi:hypothetical protein
VASGILRREVPGVTLPYWNALKNPVPEELKPIADNAGTVIPPKSLDLPNFAETDFETFQHDLEVGYHNEVHAALGHTVGRAHSPRDATFWPTMPSSIDSGGNGSRNTTVRCRRTLTS